MKFDARKYWVTWCMLRNGITQIYCMPEEWVIPVGFVWGLHIGGGNTGKLRFDVYDSYVPEKFRRQGIRSRINRAIFEELECEVITTHDGSDAGGLAFLKHWHYHLDPSSGIWCLTRRTWAKRSRELRELQASGSGVSGGEH